MIQNSAYFLRSTILSFPLIVVFLFFQGCTSSPREAARNHCPQQTRSLADIVVHSPEFESSIDMEVQSLGLDTSFSTKLKRAYTVQERIRIAEVTAQLYRYLWKNDYFQEPMFAAFSVLPCEEILPILEFLRSTEGHSSLTLNNEEIPEQRDEEASPYDAEMEAAFVKAYAQIFTEQVRNFKIPSGGMLPTLWIGDHIFVETMVYKDDGPQRGEVIVFPYPRDETKMFVKRVIGIPGDTIRIEAKQVFINDTKLEDLGYTQRVDPNIIDGSESSRDNFGPVNVPPRSYFVMGDNRDQSLDSRFWGFVSRDKILGQATYIYLSIDPEDQTFRWERAWTKIP